MCQSLTTLIQSLAQESFLRKKKKNGKQLKNFDTSNHRTLSTHSPSIRPLTYSHSPILRSTANTIHWKYVSKNTPCSNAKEWLSKTAKTPKVIIKFQSLKFQSLKLHHSSSAFDPRVNVSINLSPLCLIHRIIHACPKKQNDYYFVSLQSKLQYSWRGFYVVGFIHCRVLSPAPRARKCNTSINKRRIR